MNKYINISVAFVISTFLAINFYLLFSETSVIQKSVYVNKYERMTIDNFSEKMSKEALISPKETHTVYVGAEDEVESWVISEGDTVNVGDDLALLNTEQADGEQTLVQAEHTALLQQETEVRKILTDLTTAQAAAQSISASTVDREENVSEIDGETKIELGLDINFAVDVTQEGSYAQAIAEVEKKLTDITRKISVAEVQLAQNPARPALVSPVEGVISNITSSGSKLSVDIISSEKIGVTFAKDNEWQEIEEGDKVLFQGEGLDEAVEGLVWSVSELPVKDNEMSKAYKILDPDKAINPLAYYEVQMTTEDELQSIPYGTNINAIVITNEANDAVSMNEEWVSQNKDESGQVMMINQAGKAEEVSITIPFVWKTRAVITEGLSLGQIAIHSPSLHNYEEATKVFLPMPSYMPTKSEWKLFGWKNYLNHMIVK